MEAFVAELFVFVECIQFWFPNIKKVSLDGAQFAGL